MSSTFDFVIVGGGITGLSAAYRALSAGRSVCLIHGGDVGGVIRSTRVKGFTVEQGPNVLLEKPALARLIDDLSLRNEMIVPSCDPYDQFVWYEGQLEGVPRGFGPFVKTPLFTGGAKAKLLWKVLLGRFTRPTTDDMTVRDFFLPIVGERAAHALLGTALRGIFGAGADTLSARTIFPSFWSTALRGERIMSALKGRSKPKIFTFRGGLGTLTRKLAQALEPSIEERPARAAGILPTADGYAVVTSDGEQIRGRSVVMAAGGPEIAPLLSQIAPNLAALEASLKGVPLTVVHLAMAKKLLPKALHRSFGVLFPEDPKDVLIGVMTNSILFPHVAPEGRALLTCCLSGAQPLEWSDEECVRASRQSISRKLGIEDAESLLVTRWDAALPWYQVGHYRLVEAARALELQYPGLSFIGRDVGLPGVADRIESVEKWWNTQTSKSAAPPESAPAAANA